METGRWGDKETRRQGDKETRRQGDKEKFSPSPCLILVTAHRRENFGQPLDDICIALRELAKRNPEVEIVYPVHLNPNVREPAYRILSGQERVHFNSPLELRKIRPPDGEVLPGPH